MGTGVMIGAGIFALTGLLAVLFPIWVVSMMILALLGVIELD